MTRQEHSTALEQVVELVSQHGADAMGAAFATLLEIGMKLEREQVLGARAYERTDDRRGHANGHKPKTIDTRAGRLAVQVPKARGIEFCPLCLRRGWRRERARPSRRGW